MVDLDNSVLSGHYEKDKNNNAPILFKEFKHGHTYLDKSHLVKPEDIAEASLTKNENSISFIEAIKLRWETYIPYREDIGYIKFDLKGCTIPLRDFVKIIGKELYLDMEEVRDIKEYKYLLS